MPCARLSWPFRQVLSARKCIVSYRVLTCIVHCSFLAAVLVIMHLCFASYYGFVLFVWFYHLLVNKNLYLYNGQSGLHTVTQVNNGQHQSACFVRRCSVLECQCNMPTMLLLLLLLYCYYYSCAHCESAWRHTLRPSTSSENAASRAVGQVRSTPGTGNNSSSPCCLCALQCRLLTKLWNLAREALPRLKMGWQLDLLT